MRVGVRSLTAAGLQPGLQPGLRVVAGAGKCWLQFRHFHPHYDPAVAVPEHKPLSAELLGDGGSLLREPVNRYCTDVARPVTFRATGTAPWYSGLTLTLDDDARETSMAVWDIQARSQGLVGKGRGS